MMSVFTYTLLQPLPGIVGGASGPSLTDYLSWLFRFALVAATFLAVVQIVIGGIQMIIGGASETQRSDAKTRIQDAIYGLLLALASWLILYTINPNLAGMRLIIPEITIQAPAPTQSGVTYIIDGTTSHLDEEGSGVGRPIVGEVTPSLQTIEQHSGTINSSNTYILVDKSEKKLYVYKDGEIIASTDVNIGANDQEATKFGGEAGNKITPVGDFMIANDKRYDMNGVYSGQNANLGTAFLGISATDKNGNYRGIGIHGSVNNTLGKTNGCVRVNNADANLLYAYIPRGTRITIRN